MESLGDKRWVNICCEYLGVRKAHGRQHHGSFVLSRSLSRMRRLVLQ